MPSHVGLNSDHSFYDHLEFVSSDFSCTSSVTSSRSGMGENIMKNLFQFLEICFIHSASFDLRQILPMSHQFRVDNRAVSARIF